MCQLSDSPSSNLNSQQTPNQSVTNDELIRLQNKLENYENRAKSSEKSLKKVMDLKEEMERENNDLKENNKMKNNQIENLENSLQDKEKEIGEVQKVASGIIWNIIWSISFFMKFLITVLPFSFYLKDSD